MSHYKIQIQPRLLHFKQPAGTSRGIYTTRKVWYVLITSDESPERWGIGECAPLPDLSRDDRPDYSSLLRAACDLLEQTGQLDYEGLYPYPSILFGLEMALQHFHAGSFALWDTPFSRGEAGIPINGLIWMGDYRKMLEQIEAKLSAGYRCVKLKIGAIDFEKELDLLKHIRAHFSSSELELRVDANGAFQPDEALEKLTRLAKYHIHSIEQPIRAGQWERMVELIDSSPVPIALDEELIGLDMPHQKRKLLEDLQPDFIVLKPSLHGGIHGCTEWIRLTEKIVQADLYDDPAWWITSALESNIGLNAIAQWCATLDATLPQGLGTGLLFTDNVEMPLTIRQDCLWYSPGGAFPDLTSFQI